jgi:hypothetical protein
MNTATLPKFSGTLRFKPPVNYTGTAKAIYLIGINYYKGQGIPEDTKPSIDELIANPKKYYETVVYGLAEVEVVN